MEHESQGELDIIQKVETPRRYKVILLNDDFTPMEFVTFILQRYFSKTVPEAEKVMIQVHTEGAGVAGVYSREVAEMKVHQVTNAAKQSEYPLKTIMEAE